MSLTGSSELGRSFDDALRYNYNLSALDVLTLWMPFFFVVKAIRVGITILGFQYWSHPNRNISWVVQDGVNARIIEFGQSMRPHASLTCLAHEPLGEAECLPYYRTLSASLFTLKQGASNDACLIRMDIIENKSSFLFLPLLWSSSRKSGCSGTLAMFLFFFLFS